MKGQRKSRQIAALVFAAVAQLERPAAPLEQMASPCLPGFLSRKQAS